VGGDQVLILRIEGVPHGIVIALLPVFTLSVKLPDSELSQHQRNQ
jgi:hypothetical protein